MLRKIALFLSVFAKKLNSQGMKIATINSIRDGLSISELFERIQNDTILGAEIRNLDQLR